jgi:hypothetical protein
MTGAVVARAAPSSLPLALFDRPLVGTPSPRRAKRQAPDHSPAALSRRLILVTDLHAQLRRQLPALRVVPVPIR